MYLDLETIQCLSCRENFTETQLHNFQARALYDFDAEPGSGEVSIRVGEVLTITRTDVGEGWWEGRTPAGEAGLFPEAYVEEIPGPEDSGSQPPSMAPPPLPPDYGAGSGAHTRKTLE